MCIRDRVNNPAIVWADEPTGDLDSETAHEIMELICSLNKENGQTFVIVTHAQEVGDLADRIIHMRDGQIESQESNVQKESHANANKDLEETNQ